MEPGLDLLRKIAPRELPPAPIQTTLGCSLDDSTLPAGASDTTLEFKVNLVRPATDQTGRIVAVGTLVHRGGRIATAEGRLIAAADGKLLAHATTTCIVFPAPG